MSKRHVTTTVNGDNVEFLCSTEQTLLDVLRDELFLTGSKEGCASGDCGACSVMLDGRLVCACLVLGVEANGREVETIEGMADGDKLHPLQQDSRSCIREKPATSILLDSNHLFNNTRFPSNASR